MLGSHHLITHSFPLPLSRRRRRPPTPRPPTHFIHPAVAGLKFAVRAAGLVEAEAEAPPLQAEDGGPIKISPFSTSPILSFNDDPSPIQVATSLLLTGAISVFLFRALRRRAKRAKELRVRSTGLSKKKDLKEEALDSLKAIGVAPVEAAAPPSPVQAFLGSIAAGVITLILYKFAITVEASLNRQSISDNFSVRQITITIRTIVNGLCYLATFVFGINSLGLLLYSIQLAFSSLMGDSSDKPTSDEKEEEKLNSGFSTMSSIDAEDSEGKDTRGTTDEQS